MRFSDRWNAYPESEGDDLSVLSWNVLAPSYDNDCMSWEGARLPELKSWLQRFAACDVICLQEVDVKKSLAEISDVLKSCGFTAVVQDRKGFPVVNVTFFKHARFRLLWTQPRSRALVVGLALPDGSDLCVANVHLEAGGAGSNERQRNAQLASVLKRVSGASVICGDFNSSLEQESLLRAQLATAGLARAPTKGITLAQTSGYSDVLDHIWASESLTTRLVLGSSPETLLAITASGIPNATHPSDHLPIAATFCIKQNPSQGQAILNVPNVQIPASPAEDMRQEWLQICWHAEVGGCKRAAREQKQVEAAFFELLHGEEAANLREWRDAARKAAKSILGMVVAGAVAGVRAAEVFPTAAGKPFDPGGANLSMGGA